MKILFPLLFASLIFSPALLNADLLVNVGGAGTAGEGPTGADANYVGYSTPHENATTGQVTPYSGTTFAEGGIAGTFNVGLGFSWLDATSNATKQSFDRPNPVPYDAFYQTWVGVDIRTANGGINGGDRMELNLTGLPANTNFEFTSYHFDSHNANGSWLIDQTPSASETSSSPWVFARANGVVGLNPLDNAYTFDVTSDASGNLDITYTRNSGTFIGINGFDLVAVPSVIPEPSSVALLSLFGLAACVRRRK